MNNDLLPLGTVVRIKNYEGKYTIVGIFTFNEDKKYDYACVKYPYGFNELEDFLYANNDEVTSICFLGNINF